jgi:hypothetical protein
LLLALALVSAALAEGDRRLLPVRVPLFVSAVGLVAASLCPALRAEVITVSFELGPDSFARYWRSSAPAQFIKGAIGGFTGLGLGLAAHLSLPVLVESASRNSTLVGCLVAVGVVLGWEQIVAISALSALCRLAGLALAKGARHPIPASWSTWLAVVTCLHLVLWPFAREIHLLQVTFLWIAILLVCGSFWLAVFVALLLNRRTCRQRAENPD